MPTILIPAEHFTKSARRNYSDIDTALIREFLQNSIDAGATSVTFNITSDSLECIDNGHGMSKERMVSALLTLSGTYKAEGSIGGFGSAKEILILAHDRYEIHSLDTKVSGKVLEYEFVENPGHFNGTRIQIWFHPNYRYNFEKFLHKAKEYLSCCSPAAEITLNGEKVTDLLTCGDLARETPWGRIYIKKGGKARSYVPVRIKGVMMFAEYVGGVKNEIVVEITKPSTEILTANRDCFQYEFRPEWSKIVSEIVIDKESFGRCYQTRTTYRGRKSSYDDIELKLAKKIEENQAARSSNFPDNEGLCELKLQAKEKARQIIQSIQRVDGQIAVTQVIELALQQVASFPEWKAKQEASALVSNNLADFIIHIKDKGYDRVPEYLEPHKMGKRWQALARLWKRTVKLVLQTNGMKIPYTVGWVLDKEAGASYLEPSKNEGVHAFLLNPLQDWINDANHKRKFLQMLTKAVHETVHVSYSYHDESFLHRYEELLNKVLSELDSWWNEYLAAKNEVL